MIWSLKHEIHQKNQVVFIKVVPEVIPVAREVVLFLFL